MPKINEFFLKMELKAPGTSDLDYGEREGSYHCANCGVKVFDSTSKNESGSG